uniref:Uncharacterized protein n=1 Tax=Arundo donax TaxID=35708 RepID=A0A0A8ZC53_ARUDO
MMILKSLLSFLSQFFIAGVWLMPLFVTKTMQIRLTLPTILNHASGWWVKP